MKVTELLGDEGVQPRSGAWEGLGESEKLRINLAWSVITAALMRGHIDVAHDTFYIDCDDMSVEAKIALWGLMDAGTRSGLTRLHNATKQS